MNDHIFNVIYLCACALHGQKADIKGMDLRMVYKIAKSHAVAALAGYALGQVSEDSEKFETEKMKAIRKNILLEDDRKKLFQYLDENKIRHMSLKGSVLKDVYPKAGMRQMADNDILFDEMYREQMKDYMVQKGYKVEIYGNSNHDVYLKPPVYNFEMHISLFSSASDKRWVEYYNNVWERLVPVSESFEYHFTDEDFYVYMMAHAYKHFSRGGTGLRTLCDCYVYLWKKGDILDRSYIQGELKKLGLLEFETSVSSLAQKLFLAAEKQEESQLTKEEVKLLSYMCGSGTYGTWENTITNQIEKSIGTKKPDYRQKIKYLLGRVFPDEEWYEKWCPFCRKHKLAIPFFLVFRFFRGIIFRRRKVKAELCSLKEI